MLDFLDLIFSSWWNLRNLLLFNCTALTSLYKCFIWCHLILVSIIWNKNFITIQPFLFPFSLGIEVLISCVFKLEFYLLWGNHKVLLVIYNLSQLLKFALSSSISFEHLWIVITNLLQAVVGNILLVFTLRFKICYALFNRQMYENTPTKLWDKRIWNVSKI